MSIPKTEGLNPYEAIPKMREDRIAAIKEELTTIADRHAKGGSEKTTDSVAHSRALKEELHKLNASSLADRKASTPVSPTTTKKGFDAPSGPAVNH